jgi:hypothetical protein
MSLHALCVPPAIDISREHPGLGLQGRACYKSQNTYLASSIGACRLITEAASPITRMAIDFPRLPVPKHSFTDQTNHAMKQRKKK